MNVLALVPLYVPHSRVGAWITTHEYLRGLAARGHQVTVVTVNGTAHDPYTIDGVQVFHNGTDVDPPDVVVSHLGDTGQGAALAHRLGVPSVRMAHGHHPDNRARLDTHPCALAVFSSEALRADTGWDGPSIVAHPPVRAEDYRCRPGKSVTLSNLSRAKGGLLLGWIAEAHPTVPFLGVRGWGFQNLRQPANVEITEMVPDMRAVYRRTRILLVPSELESYGRVGVEAACSGIPTIGHPSPGLVEAMGDHATWVDRHDRAGWIAAVGDLLDPEAWKAASRRARGAIQKDPDATVALVADSIEALA